MNPRRNGCAHRHNAKEQKVRRHEHVNVIFRKELEKQVQAKQEARADNRKHVRILRHVKHDKDWKINLKKIKRIQEKRFQL